MFFFKLRKFLLSCFVLSTGVTQAQTTTPLAGKDFSKSFATNDTIFRVPYIDVDEWRNEPVRHHYIHGGFRGTDTRFSYYFPSQEQYGGRFFQYITPVPDNENLSQGATGEGDKIGFSISSGAYFVETNGGGKAAMPAPGTDASLGAYRANAAAAQFSRVIAMQLFGGKRPYGYAFGGSGGAFRTVSLIENTDGVWNGVVPFVLGSPMAIPNVFSVRMFGMRVLQHKFPQITDALEPGGSGDMYAGLDNEEKEALQEVTKMGFPPKAWVNYKKMGIHAFPAIYPSLLYLDKKYFTDFWTVPGYLGANPPASLLQGRIQQVTTIKAGISEPEAIKMGITRGPLPGEAHGSADAAWKAIGEKDGTMPVAFQLSKELPDVQFLGGEMLVKSGASAGKSMSLSGISGDKVVLGTNDLKVLAAVKPGDTVQVDNSNYLAAQTYHRHQVPGKDYPVWNQFRDAAGNPIYPQRPMLVGPLIAKGATGTLQSGKFKGKMIVVESLWDTEAYPWQADWYRNKVKENQGDTLDNNFRLWFTDHANHADFVNPGDPTHLVSYLGVLQQALRDISNWAEKGIAPPANTTYKIEDGQVIVPQNAADRKGIQPVIMLKANGGEKAEIKAGETVNLTATIDVPPGTGKVVLAEWDFDGAGTFSEKGKLVSDGKNTFRVMVSTMHKFTQPGTYFVVLRAASQRQGNSTTPYTLIKNLERVRVIVK